MKKWIALFLAGVLMVTGLAACDQGKTGGSGKNPTTAEVVEAIDAAFVEKYPDLGLTGAINNMPMNVDDTTLEEKFGVSTGDVVDYTGVIAGMMTNCDMLLVVKASPDKIDTVKAALETAVENQKAAFESYAVMGNDLRLDAAKVVVSGDYAALLMVGILDDDTTTMEPDVEMAEKAFLDAVE